MNDTRPLARVTAVEPIEGFRLRLTFTDGLVRVFANPLSVVRRLRNAGLLAFDLLPPAKAALSRLSTGAGGGARIPKLARGVALQ